MKKRQIDYNHIGETIYKSKLANGLTVVLLPKKEMTKTFAIFATDYGSIDQSFIPVGENEKVTVPNGIAHFLEHKLFEKEDRDVFQDFSKYGASANAFTSFTTTAYLFSATNQIEKNLETLLDFVQSPYFSDESVEKEKGIIAQEIKMYDDQPGWRSFMGTIENMFEHHPVNIDIAGTVDSINQITKEDLYLCYNTFYHPSNMILFIVGNFDLKIISNLIETNQNDKQFISDFELKRFFPEEQDQVFKQKSILNMDVSIPRVTIGIKEYSKPLDKDELLKKDLLNTMILNHFYSKGGKFHQQLYESSLIDDSFFFDSTISKNFGYSLIGGKTRHKEKLTETIKDQLLQIKEYKFTEEEFNRQKKKQIGKIISSMNSLEFIANEYISYYHLNIDFFNILPTIQHLTSDDINEYVRNWISEEKITTHWIVPKN